MNTRKHEMKLYAKRKHKNVLLRNEKRQNLEVAYKYDRTHKLFNKQG